MVRREILAVGLLTIAALVLSGCRVERSGDDRGEDLKVATPFGGLQVKTDESVQASVGLPAYPGAQPVKKRGDDNGAADVNLSFGRFQLRVKALSYRSGDDPEKVKAFYKQALGQRYGDVIECAGHRAVGQPARTNEGLTCEEGKDKHGSGNDLSGDLELKAGSEHHQHVVGIEREGAGTKFALLALDLPGGLPTSDGGPEAK